MFTKTHFISVLLALVLCLYAQSELKPDESMVARPVESVMSFIDEEMLSDSADIRERPMSPMAVGLEIGQSGEDAYIASDKVGIGIPLPSSKLDIDGDVRVRTINNAPGDILTVSGTGVVQKRTPEEIRTDIGAAQDLNSVYYVEGNTSGSSGTWTGSITGLTAYYDGLKIAYKIGVAGISTGTTLNLNGLGAIACRRNNGNLTTHLPVGTVVYLTYTTISGTGYWVWADYDSTESYTVRWNSSLQAGAEITRYKIVMAGTDGRWYPLTIGNTTAATKTVASTEFRIESPIVSYYYNGTVAAGATSSSYWYEGYTMANLDYTLNQSTGFSAYMPLYLKGTINSNGNFVLDGAGGVNNDFWTQTLPSTEDGKVYIMIGIMHSTTDTMRLMVNKPIYEFKDGNLRVYTPEHVHDSDYDNYNYWTASDGSNSSNIGSATTLTYAGSGGVTTTLAGNTLTIDAAGATPSPGGNDGNVQYKLGTSFAGSNNLHWDNTNARLGIGTASPAVKLDVIGAVKTSRLGSYGTYNSSQVQGIWSISEGYPISTASNDFGTQYGIVYAHTNAGTGTSKLPIAGWGHQILFTSAGTRNASISLTNGHAYFAGNLGVGTTSPSYKLDVSGTGRFTEQVVIPVTPTANAHAASKQYVDGLVGGGVGSGTANQTLRHNGTTWIATSNLYNNGTNIGIGTTSPTANLHVNGSVRIDNHLEARATWGENARTQGILIIPEGTAIIDNGTGSLTIPQLIVMNPAAGSWMRVAAGTYSLGSWGYLYVDIPPTGTSRSVVTPSIAAWSDTDRLYDSRDRIILAQRRGGGAIYTRFAQPANFGDNWGAQVVQSDASLEGNGTSVNNLKVANCSAKSQSTNYKLHRPYHGW